MTEKHKLREHSCAHVVFGILCFMVTLAAAALQRVYLLLVRPRGLSLIHIYRYIRTMVDEAKRLQLSPQDIVNLIERGFEG